MRIKLMSVMVENQERALQFYTEALGFVKKLDIPLGEFRWLTVVSPDGPDDLELLLEPNANPAGQVFQKALFDQGIPAASFFSDDVAQDYERMSALGVVFRTKPTTMPWGTFAVLEDTVGNLIQVQKVGGVAGN